MKIASFPFLLLALVWAPSNPAVAQTMEASIQKARIAEACGVELKLSEAGCGCVSDRAMSDLSDVQREYLLATAVAPSAAARMRGRVSNDDIQVLAKFLATAAQECSSR